MWWQFTRNNLDGDGERVQGEGRVGVSGAKQIWIWIWTIFGGGHVPPFILPTSALALNRSHSGKLKVFQE